MRRSARTSKPRRYGGAIALFTILAGVALFLEDYAPSVISDMSKHKVTMQEQGEIFGMTPDPVQPKMVDPVVEPFSGKHSKKVVIKRIPRISKGMVMPHPYWGDCVKCHLYKGVDKAGGEWKSPVGKALETVSTIMKVGPRIRPDSVRPHPPAGRCIKCHDIVVDQPV